MAAVNEIERYQVSRSSDLKKPVAYIIRQLKRPEEIKFLRDIYGGRFLQISANNDQEEKNKIIYSVIDRENPGKKPLEIERLVQKIVYDDSNEVDEMYGQRISDTFYTADFFVKCKNMDSLGVSIKRFMKGIFGSNLISPTRDEYGSYFAKSASLKSVDMSRQVGAAIFTQGGEIVITGCNDVAKSGGGLFWEEDVEKHRDIDIVSEANKEETGKIIYNFLDTLRNKNIIKENAEDILGNNDFKEAIMNSMIGDITEYGRMIHAEMNAITDAARLGRPLNCTNMYVTTYPCHNCAKHIVASGVKRVIYIEPYPKSRADKLYSHAIVDNDKKSGVVFEHFYGFSPTIYKSVFERQKRKSVGGGVREWQYDTSKPVFEIKEYKNEQEQKSKNYENKLNEMMKLFSENLINE